MTGVSVTSVELPEVCVSEVMRYAGYRSADECAEREIMSCIEEASDIFSSRVAYAELDVRIDGEICDFGLFSVKSAALAKNLKGSRQAVVFAATAGVGIDRLITRYSRLSPSRSVLFQAIGTERVEALCDAFCNEYARDRGVALKHRFSPGYADLSLDTQREIFKILDCKRKIGVSLNESLLMSPSKSVTAFVGIK
ncbi:MAG: Vitamin B12 dependent methionine synthase activation subunit [Clostridia bacterium]|nr:Vitamin B12 dependent methionine synthase activation subunit [Clostridia bacterium]